MLINFTPFLPSEINILIDFIISDNWPFHGYPKITPEQIKKNFEEGFYTGDGIETFWIIADGEKAGMIRLYDLEDLTPLFDIRISSSYQGKGIGEKGVKWLTEYVFKTYSHIMRIEGYTTGTETIRVENSHKVKKSYAAFKRLLYYLLLSQKVRLL